jgi:hypothetical protein
MQNAVWRWDTKVELVCLRWRPKWYRQYQSVWSFHWVSKRLAVHLHHLIVLVTLICLRAVFPIVWWCNMIAVLLLTQRCFSFHNVSVQWSPSNTQLLTHSTPKLILSNIVCVERVFADVFGCKFQLYVVYLVMAWLCTITCLLYRYFCGLPLCIQPCNAAARVKHWAWAWVDHFRVQQVGYSLRSSVYKSQCEPWESMDHWGSWSVEIITSVVDAVEFISYELRFASLCCRTNCAIQFLLCWSSCDASDTSLGAGYVTLE